MVIPTYNERHNVLQLIPRIVEELAAAGVDGVLVIVDDNSPDGTAEVARELSRMNNDIHVIVRPEKAGIGTAYIEGFRWALMNKRADVLIQMDADLSHPPTILRELIRWVTEESYHVVIASRYVPGGAIRGWGFTRRVTSLFANLLARSLLKLDAKDTTSGYRAISREAARALLTISLNSVGYSYQVESLYAFQLLNLRIKEIPFTFVNRLKGRSKLSLAEIPRFLSTILRLSIAGSKPVPRPENPQIVASGRKTVI